METIYHFGVLDYLVFAGMLIICAVIGIYYGYCKTPDEDNLSGYLQGSKSMTPFPVAMSLVGGYTQLHLGIGTPTEIYNYGTQYWLIAVAIWIHCAIISYVYLPVFFKLQVTSSYEVFVISTDVTAVLQIFQYLEMRFGREVRTLVSVLFILDEIMFLPIVIYVPSLAFNQVTGIGVHLVGSIVCVICVLYTSLGGMKAIVYTDTLQIVIMFLSVIVVILLGTFSLGPSNVWIRNYEGHRIIFGNFNPSMYERHTVFAVMIGGVIYWTAFNSVNQTMVQKYLTLGTEKESRMSIFLFTIGVSAFVSFCIYCGLLIYAKYYKCDPLSAKRIHHDDQLLPLYVMELGGHLLGIPGLFMAGLFGAALSSLAVVLNSTSAVILEDFIKGCLRIKLRDRTSTAIAKIVALALGALSIGFLFIVDKMTGIFAGAVAISAIVTGTSFGIFSLGMLIPWSNSLGVIMGGITGTIVTAIVSFGNQYVLATGLVVPHKLSVNTDKCFSDYGIHANVTVIHYPDESSIFPLFRLSYHWITPLGILTTIVVGTIVSFATGKTDLKQMDPEMLSPVAQWLLPSEAQSYIGSASRRVREREDNE